MKKIFGALIVVIFLFVICREEIFVTAKVDGKTITIAEVAAELNLPLEINFIHSVQKTPVIEELEFDGEKFILRRSKYKSHGVGLPFMESDGNFYEEDGFFIMDDMNRPIENLSLRTGVGTNLTIKLDGEEFKLYEKFPAGTQIDIFPASKLKKFLNENFGRNF